MDPTARYNVLKAAILECEDMVKIQDAIDFYYRVHENRQCPCIPRANKKMILVQLAGETVNRDMIKYISEGTWGTTADQMLLLLK